MRSDLQRTSLMIALMVVSCSCTAPGNRGVVNAFQATPAAQPAASDNSEPLLRFPDIHGDQIVFVSGEDIWIAPTSGGVATRLTINDGEERYPKFSPDGSMIAFTGQYDGNADVYVMNTLGGDIRRVTYHPGFDEVIGWHPQKNKILFRSSRSSASRYTHLFLINPDGTGLEELILNEAANGSFSPDGSKIAYNRVSRENRTWKRYRGGTAQEVYVYDFGTNQERNITNFRGTDRIPMWIGNRIYFSSDRDRLLNIYSLDANGGDLQQHTHHTDYDVRRPSKDGNRIVYEHAGSIWLLDLASDETHKVDITVGQDPAEARPYLADVSDDVSGIDISPSGVRGLLVARGEVFTVPKKDGPTRNLSNDCGAHDKNAVWSPDGQHIAFLSDRSGEYEIYLVDPKGESPPEQLTHHKDGYRHTLRWSPDSKKIAFADQTLRFYYLDIETKKITEVDRPKYESVDVSLDRKQISDFSWSPDSRYLTYSKMNQDLLFQVWAYSLETGEKTCVSSGLFSDFDPVFTRDGEHIIFVSNRRFDPTFCDFEWEMVYKNAAGLYAVTLRSDGPSIQPYKSDDETAEDKDKKDDKDTDAKDSQKDEHQVRIDAEGLPQRIEALPVEAGNYRKLAVNDSTLFYLNADKGDFNRFEFRAVGPRTLYAYSFDDRESSKVIEGIDGYRLSSDGSTIIYKKGSHVGMLKSSAKDAKGDNLKLSGLKMFLDPKREWRQIFNEAWRMERDFYYEPNMHGLDWNAKRTQYGRLLDRASCRQDLGFIIGELIGDLNTSHTYVFGGDRRRKADNVNVGMLGVDWEIDPNARLYRFKKVYRIPDWTQDVIPPLGRPDTHVDDGEYLLAVNGQDVATDHNIYRYFQNLAHKQVTLTVSKTPNQADAREIVVEPLRGERTLRYLDWVEGNRQKVAQASDGQIGYLHLPDTYLGSAREFPKYFYSQTRKKGIIVDGRYNGGGLDPDIFLQRLNKQLLTYWTRRQSHDQTTPFVVTTAHLACITNRQAGSGGDMLPMEFRMLKMGPVIGTRTWGGLVGVSMFIGLIDGGGLTAPDYRVYDSKGNWIVENEGITPDIEVDLHPAEMARGYDAQLMKAVEYLQQKIKEDPRPWPKHPPFPVDK